MSNPATAAILAELDVPEIVPFVAAWDDLEALVVHVFRAKTATKADRAAFAEIHQRLQTEFPRWQPDLADAAQGVSVRGEPLAADPFTQLLASQELDVFLTDWSLMQLLPAARETLNLFLIACRDA